MTLKDIINLVYTDEFAIRKGNSLEEIRTYEKGSYAALKKYYNDTVERIIPHMNCLEIDLAE